MAFLGLQLAPLDPLDDVGQGGVRRRGHAAALCPGATSRNISSLQRLTAIGQRPWKRQPDGGLRASGDPDRQHVGDQQTSPL
jgi:hypothetical protein